VAPAGIAGSTRFGTPGKRSGATCPDGKENTVDKYTAATLALAGRPAGDADAIGRQDTQRARGTQLRASFVVHCWQHNDGEPRYVISHVQSGIRTLAFSLNDVLDWVKGHCQPPKPGVSKP
jgi:hypothetical protein